MTRKVEKAMEDYFALLLDEPKALDEPKTLAEPKLSKAIAAQPLEQLLSKVSAPAPEVKTKAEVKEKVEVKTKAAVSPSTIPATKTPVTDTRKLQTAVTDKPSVAPSTLRQQSSTVTTKTPVTTETPVTTKTIVPATESSAVSAKLRDALPENFQVLYFEVAGLTLAVPLTALGGIQKLKKVNQLFGKPKWFMGVQVNREQQINVVDTALWVMPEKYTDELAQSLDYQYIIQIGDSGWGLACEKLVDADPIVQQEIKWRQRPGKRPWLAGTVKARMCGLLAVDPLVELLEQGLGS